MLRQRIYLLFLCIPLIASAQTPCSSDDINNPGIINQAGTANDFDCVGLTLQSYISASTMGGAEAQDSWGWTDPLDDKEYAIVTLDNGTAFVNITDPVNPLYLGRLDSHSGGSNLWRDVKVYNNHAYIVSEVTSDGVQIFDLTTLRGLTGSPVVNFTEDGFLFIGDGGSNDGRAHNIVINEDSGFAYIVGVNRSSNSSDGPIFVDLSNPTSPSIVGEYGPSDYFHDAQVVTYDGPDPDYQGREIMIGCNENNMKIVDVTDKSNPIDISTVVYANTNYTHQGWFTEDKRFFIVGDETDEQNIGFNTRTLVFDLQDLDQAGVNANNPGGNAFYTYTGSTAAIDHNGYVRGNRFYLANYSAGVRVLKVDGLYDATPSMEEVDYMDTYKPNNTAAFNGTWNVYPYFDSGNLIATGFGNVSVNGDGGLFVMKDPNYDNTDPTAICQSYTATIDGTTNTVTIDALDVDGGSTDDFGIVKRTLTGQTTFTCADVGTHSVTLTVEDDYGNSASCVATITVVGETTTYTGGAWDNGTPGAGSNAKFSQNYNTSAGDITACSCEIDAAATVTIGADEFIDITQNITVNGTLTVEHQGTVRQDDDNATTVNNGTINVELSTPSLDER
ncbi:MAG: choice-of-anchor B family protein, partial [Bacteroidetes bacterium]|nr:choice-of-anchor B family protein [Bacteroidota bacterium]